MNYQSEQQLEDNLIGQLSEQGFARVILKDNAALEVNLKQQLEKVNSCTLSDTELRKYWVSLVKVIYLQKPKHCATSLM